MKYLILIAFLTIQLVSFGQIANINDANGVPLRRQTYEMVEGSPYFNNGNWALGSMVSKDDKLYDNVRLRYNAYEDKLEYYKDGTPFMLKNSDIKEFKINIMNPTTGDSEIFHFKNGFEVNGVASNENFLRVLYEGDKIKILEKIQVEKIKVTPASYGEADYDKFVGIDKVYVVNGNTVDETNLNKKAFYNISPNNKSKIKKYISDKDIDFDKPKDIASLAGFVESLLAS